LTDTNCFTSNTVTARTHQALSELLGYKFDANLIKEYYFNNQSLKKTKLEAKVLNSVKLYKNNTVAVMKIPYSDIEKFNLSFEDTMGIVDKGTAIEGVGMSIILIEAGPGYVYVSLRGKGSEVDVSKFAKEFGGGGSNTIAAFQYHGELKDIEQLVHTYIKEKIEVISQDPDEKKLF
jgi:phosphoesterase RecJ-like protein